MTFIAILLLSIIIYTYLFYFILTFILSLFIQKKIHKATIQPTVTLMIAAYNEELNIEKKIINSLKLNYPKEKLEIVVVSDGSTDNTDKIVQKYHVKGVKLIRIDGRVGKTQARNIALRKISSQIILFSDATTEYSKDVILKLVQNFADPSVGMVTGHLIYKDPSGSQMGIGQKIFWKYETIIKRSQTNLGTLTGSVGCITAFRKVAYSELPSNIIEDFTNPLMFILQGYRVVFEPEAICYEYTTKKVIEEWNMRVRVIRGGLTGLYYAKSILNPLRYPVACFQLLSHKVLRWLIPVFAILLLYVTVVGSVVTPNTTLYIFLILQVIFYSIVLIAFTLGRLGINKYILAVPYYLFIVNAASLIALYKTVTQKLDATWETQREV